MGDVYLTLKRQALSLYPFGAFDVSAPLYCLQTMLKKWLVTGALVLALGGLGALVPWWWPRLLDLAGTHSAKIEGLAGMVQIAIWIGGILFLVYRFLRGRPETDSSTPSSSVSTTADVQGPGNLTQGDDNVTGGAGSNVFGHVTGNVYLLNASAGPVDSQRLLTQLGESHPPEDLTRATKSYLEYLVECYRYLDFRGMGVSDRVPLKLPLLEMYVPLKARMETPEGETWTRTAVRLAGRSATEAETEGMGQRLSGPLPVLDLLREQAGLVVLGDPGAGKTTLLRFLALTLATGQGEKLGLGNRLPVLLPLAAYANALAAGNVPLERFIASYYQENKGIGLPLNALLARGLAQGGMLFLLDGLDEVREREIRHRVVDRVRDFYNLHRNAGNKFILTSRIVGYREVRPEAEGLAECTLVDFDTEDIEEFVGRWTAALEKAARGESQVAQTAAERERTELLAAVEANAGVRSLASNPLLLTILALMKRQGVTLPDRRVELYKTYLDTLLKHWNLARSEAGRTGRDLDLVETTRILAPLALWMHEVSPGVGLVKEWDLRRELVKIYESRGDSDPVRAADKFLEDVREHAALLLDRGGRQYGFIHLTFQEYLAAVALAQRAQKGAPAVAEVLAEHVGEAPWHEVTLLTIGHLGIIQQWDEVAGAVLEQLLAKAPEPPGEVVVLAGRAVADAGPGGVTAACRQKVIDLLLEVIRDDQRVAASRRAAAGEALAALGDPRPGIATVASMVFCTVPAGAFRMGSEEQDSEAYDSEKPAHNVNIPYGYRIGRYPVTVAQFRQFVKASGLKPGDPDCLRGPENHPVVWVDWREAVAFCEWMTEVGHKEGWLEDDWVVRLPSEAEWEKAARGTDGRIYPWGPEPDPNRANYDDAGIGRPSTVGCFPGGTSPCGCEEMSGNVWEWTLSPWVSSYVRKDRENDNRDNSEGRRRVVRGGSYFLASRLVRCAFRYGLAPDDWHDSLGFRVVAAPFSSAP